MNTEIKRKQEIVCTMIMHWVVQASYFQAPSQSGMIMKQQKEDQLYVLHQGKLIRKKNEKIL